MLKYVIQGGKPLHGEINISGAKNAAVAIIPAALMVDGPCRIENIPQISDVTLCLKILEQLGASIRTINRHTVEINCSVIRSTRTSYELARKIRASYYLIGALLGRFGKAEVAMPGGCNFGVRPIDQHVKGFTTLGAKVVVEGGFIHASTETGRLKGANVYLDVVSVGATMNIMMAAVMAEGNTIIENAAKEPHIVDLANFLNSMGANIRGAGTDTIKIQGVDRLRGGTYAIIPDQIEAGTYMAAVAATGGQVLIKNIIPKHMDCITAKLVEMGVEVDDVLPLVEQQLKRQRIYFGLYSLKYAGKSGRIPSAAVFVGEALGIKPIMQVWDHAITTVGKARGEKKLIREIVKMVEDDMEPNTPYSLVYGCEEVDRDEICEELTKKIGYPPVYSFQIGPAVAINAGPRVVGAIFEVSRKKLGKESKKQEKNG